ncbi:MAG: response regulator transcription factor [Verrucomicrobiota bacterium]|nr:response regulator transcription factor [Verrucomicrobiota bacterium]MCC6821654.1 response regulator transcription factor [Limisphaerales bacterium]
MAIAVAILEDDPATRGIVAGWIDNLAGFRCVAQYADAEAALAALPGVAPDVVLTDINLPEMNGIECVRQLKPQLPSTQFVMVTVYGDTEHIFDALAAGATGYLLKRLDREELKAALEEVHRGGSPMSSSIARKVVQFFGAPPPTSTVELESLSPRELEVLHFLAEGYVNKEIADLLAISGPTVATYIRRIYEKLHVRSRAAAIGKFSSLIKRQNSAGSRATSAPILSPLED